MHKLPRLKNIWKIEEEKRKKKIRLKIYELLDQGMNRNDIQKLLRVNGQVIAHAENARDEELDVEPEANEYFFPTIAWPGSEEKIEVLRLRVQFRQPLWHPKDRGIYDKSED